MVHPKTFALAAVFVLDAALPTAGITTGSNVHSVADSLFNGLVALDQELKPSRSATSSGSRRKAASRWSRARPSRAAATAS